MKLIADEDIEEGRICLADSPQVQRKCPGFKKGTGKWCAHQTEGEDIFFCHHPEVETAELVYPDEL